MTPTPHRISLARGWRGSLQRWERTFHAPTLPATVTQVRLVISLSQAKARQIQLNGEELTWNQRDSQLDCEVKDRLQSINKLVIHTDDSTHCNSEIHSNPPFEAYLEIIDEA
jgi:hypothetical protein